MKRSVVFDSVELLLVVKNTLVLVDRGDIALLSILNQAYDTPNVTSLELDLGETHFMNIRKLDKSLELRLQAVWRKAVLHTAVEVELPRIRVCVVAVYS
jgi:hypothetical protein